MNVQRWYFSDMKKAISTLAVLFGVGLMAGCDIMNLDLGNGYAYNYDYPWAIWKKETPSSGPIILTPQDSIHDEYVVVNIYWDKSTILAVCCENKYSIDSTCWSLDKNTGIVKEITAEEFNATVSHNNMDHDYLLSRYESQ